MPVCNFKGCTYTHARANIVGVHRRRIHGVLGEKAKNSNAPKKRAYRKRQHTPGVVNEADAPRTLPYPCRYCYNCGVPIPRTLDIPINSITNERRTK